MLGQNVVQGRCHARATCSVRAAEDRMGPMKRLAIAAAAAVLMTATGGAEEPRDDREAEQEKRICRSEKMTGSLTRVRRICLTRSEWSRLAEVTRKGVEELRRCLLLHI